MKKYKCIKDYCPLLRNKSRQFYYGNDPKLREEVLKHNESIELIPTKIPVVKNGDIMVQMGPKDSRFQSQINPKCALYEYILQEYNDCFIEIKE